MSNAAQLYQVNLTQACQLMMANRKRTTLIEGHMGSGKSTLLKMLSQKLPKHVPVYFDGTTKDLGDMAIPSLQTIDEQGFVRFIPNEELGIHLGKPVILMFDEVGKMNPSVKNACLRIFQEREFGSYKLHPDSIVFGTTNIAGEGVGDLLPPHARNRMTVVRMRKSTNVEFIEDFAIPNGLDPALIAWCADKPELFVSYEDVKDPKDNVYIYHPLDKSRTSFVTNRSLHSASDWLLVRDQFDDTALTAALIGTIGAPAAAELATYVRTHDQLPSIDEIKNDPHGARVPTSPIASAMVVYRTLSTIDRSWMDAWMDYSSRLHPELQMMFAQQVKRPTYNKQSDVMTNGKFTAWCLANNFAFAADKK
jgi:energy-coupling factor transporter ATP-binding protein EcfA2